MRILSWNVNGLRAVLKKNFLEFLEAESPDILCLQETKCQETDVDQIWPGGYKVFFLSADKKGYSGTAIFTKKKPLSMAYGMNKKEHDTEGRVITAEYPDFYLVNVYTPNAQDGLRRIEYRQKWDKAYLAYLRKLEKTKPVITCGDFNCAHKEIDLARPKANVNNPGFSPQERAGFDKFVKAGFVDTFREFETGPDHYSWWSYRGGARERNVGWRIDYFLVSTALKPRLKNAFIKPDVMGSDHCPVGIELKRK